MGVKKKKIIKLIFFSIIKIFSKNLNWHSTSPLETNEIKSKFKNSTIFEIPNGIDFSEIQNLKKLSRYEFLEFYLNKKVNNINKIIVSLGRIHIKKNYKFLIKSFKKLKKENYILLISGHDYDNEKIVLQKVISEEKLENNVFIIDPIDNSNDKFNFLFNADLFVLMSENENFGNVYLESLAVGTPIIASDQTPWEAVNKKKCGFCIPIEENIFIKKVFEILKHKKTYFTKNCISFSKEFEINYISKLFISAYDKILNDKKN